MLAGDWFIIQRMAGQKKFGCKNCGADLVFEPGSTTLTCPYCGVQNEIQIAPQQIQELDYKAALAGTLAQQETTQVLTAICTACGAETTFPPNVTTQDCPYCGATLIAQNTHTVEVLRPQSLLPFAVTQTQSQESVTKWIHGLWFAPNKLKQYAEKDSKLKGLYIPYWTYDCDTISNYNGARGEHYYVTEHYTTTENGRSVSKTRQVQKTRWYPATGTVPVDFDDVLVNASNSLPRNFADKLEPWDLHALVPFQEDYLPGFVAERYQVDLAAGFEVAKGIMESGIHSAIRSDIGGDEQRIDSVSSTYNDITFKHVLLPLWIGAYRYQGKVYQILVNARTREVQGSRPYSALKITLFVLFILLVIILLIHLANN